ncbi:MAG: hypothetical protein GTO16_12865 [Candidatus Aminicenantes bacterium]|nr:hypothetical protein [Candidatus Aminicenantes bacterium]
MSNKKKTLLRSGAKRSLFVVPCWLLLVVPSLFFLLVSSSVSVENSFMDREDALAKEQEALTDLEWKEVAQVTILGNVDWTDTGLEVKEDQKIYFSAQKQISLQRGNPMAWCGPDGMDRKTMQQPISDKNIGALIGKVVWLISIEVDEETGEQIRHEIIEKFYIGSANQVKMPISGRLFLGINENVVGDNSGEFEVIIYLPLLP